MLQEETLAKKFLICDFSDFPWQSPYRDLCKEHAFPTFNPPRKKKKRKKNPTPDIKSTLLNLSLSAAEFHHLGALETVSLNLMVCILKSVIN